MHYIIIVFNYAPSGTPNLHGGTCIALVPLDSTNNLRIVTTILSLILPCLGSWVVLGSGGLVAVADLVSLRPSSGKLLWCLSLPCWTC